MIYVSSSCARAKTILDSIGRLARLGYKNIELSGGTEFLPDLAERLLIQKKDLRLNLLCHNYFPPPKEDFVLNLASLDDDVFERTISHFKQAIELSMILGADSFGLHTGLFLDLKPCELDGRLERKELYDREACLSRFCEGYEKLTGFARSINFYLENLRDKLNNPNLYLIAKHY